MGLSKRIYQGIVLLSSLLVMSNCAVSNMPVSQDMNDVFPDEKTELQSENTIETPAEIIEPAPETTAVEVVDNAPVVQEERAGDAKKEPGDDEEQALLDAALELTVTAQTYWEEGDMDQALESLDMAFANILRVPANNPKHSQQKEDLRFVISKRIMEMYASQHVTVKGNHHAIPLTINDHVEREIRSFQTIERNFFLEAYQRSGRYRGAMVKALKEAGIPEEISWLPLIESGYKVRALSRARAFGLWQFIPSTGYKFGLKRTTWIDERLDPEKSTAAAIAYMNELHQMFGDWATVLAAYNCGEGAVGRVIRNQKVNYLDNFWDFYGRLPRETARYFPRFLAVLAIVNDPAKYGFTLPELDAPFSYETVVINKPVRLKTLAEKLSIDVKELAALNPELRRDATPNSEYALRVPPGKKEETLACMDNIVQWTPPREEYVQHRVRRGETLSVIALRYRTSVQKIMEANNIRSARMLRIGQKLKIPARSAS